MIGFDQFKRGAGFVASLAYASGFKRLGREHLVGLVCACALVPGAAVVMSGPLPSCAR